MIEEHEIKEEKIREKSRRREKRTFFLAMERLILKYP